MAFEPQLRPRRGAFRRGGFSFVELLVSLLIISVLYALYFGPGNNAIQAQRKSECARQLQQIAMVLNAYAADHNGAFPSVAGAKSPSEPLSLLVPQYTTDTSLFICPGGRDSALAPARPFAGRRISYAYYMGCRQPGGSPSADAAEAPLLSDAQINANPKRRGKPVFAASDRAPGNNHRGYGGNIVFIDGHRETAEPCGTRDLPVFPGIILLNPE